MQTVHVLTTSRLQGPHDCSWGQVMSSLPLVVHGGSECTGRCYFHELMLGRTTVVSGIVSTVTVRAKQDCAWSRNF